MLHPPTFPRMCRRENSGAGERPFLAAHVGRKLGTQLQPLEPPAVSPLQHFLQYSRCEQHVASVTYSVNFFDVPADPRPLIRRSAIMAAAAKDSRLKKCTLTNLYNERPTWLKLAHETLDRAVLAAYAAVDPEGHWTEDWAEVWLDTGAGQKLPKGHPLATRRAEVDQKVLANLLRMNQTRANSFRFSRPGAPGRLRPLPQIGNRQSPRPTLQTPSHSSQSPQIIAKCEVL
jgi:hypothetical protein